MRPSIRRWLDWVMNDVRPLSRSRPRRSAIHLRYELAGLSFDGGPVPWNADSVTVVALLRLPAKARQASQFALRMPGTAPVPPNALRGEGSDRYRLEFQIPVPASTAVGELLWRQRVLCRVEVPVLEEQEFFEGFSVAEPTAFVRLGPNSVPARYFVASQCRGLSAVAILHSRSPLAPLAEAGLSVAVRNERTGAEAVVPVVLTNAQRASKEAVVSVSFPRMKRYGGTQSIVWQAGGRELARQIVCGIPARRFERSIRVRESRFLVPDKLGRIAIVKQPPPGRGPCAPAFFVQSAEAGTAGIARFRIRSLGPYGRVPPDVERDVLVTDAPALVCTDLLSDPGSATGFELHLKDRALAYASMSPVPAAAITAEGGFKPPPDFPWSGVAEEELQERLNRLMNGG